MFLNNRYHDPSLGVFISVDPLVQMTGEPYIYASGNPTTLSDPTGLCPFEGCWEAFDAYLRGLADATTHVQQQDEHEPGRPLPLQAVIATAESYAQWSLHQNSPGYDCFPRACGQAPRLVRNIDLQHDVDWSTAGSLAFGIGAFTPCSVYCAWIATGFAAHSAYESCGDGLTTACAWDTAGLAVSGVGAAAQSTRRVATSAAARLGSATDAAKDGLEVSVESSSFWARAMGASDELLVVGPRPQATRAYILSAATYYSRSVAGQAQAVGRIATVADLAFMSRTFWVLAG